MYNQSLKIAFLMSQYANKNSKRLKGLKEIKK